MKILMTLMSLDIGGAETHVVELAKQLRRRGHTVIVVSNGGVYVEEIKRAGIVHYRVPLHSRKLKDMLSAYIQIKKIIKKERPDVVHAHARIPAFICGLVRKTVPFRFVTSAHGTYMVSASLKFLTNWGDRTLAVSDDIRRYLIQNYGVPKEKIIVSINGVDMEKFSPEISPGNFESEYHLQAGNPKIVYVSRLNEDVCAPAVCLLDEFFEMEKQCPGLELIVVGGGTYFDTLKEKADGINSALGRNAVVLTGPRTDVNRILAAATVCVGVSRAILEPMAMEKPVVIAGNEGYIGIFQRRKLDLAISCNFTCRQCQPLDAKALSTDVLRVLAMSDEERRELGEYGRKVIEEHYSLDKMVDDNLKLYREEIRGDGFDAAILGYYGFKNSGDDALLHAIIDSLRERKKDIRLMVLSFNPAETKAQYHVESISRFHIWKLRKLFKKTKVLLAGGGSLVQDVTSTKSLVYYLYVMGLARRCGAKVMMYANGIGPVKKSRNRQRAKTALNKADIITLRDTDSENELKELGVTEPKIEVTADPAFALTRSNDHEANDILEKFGIQKDTEFVCISVRKWNGAPDNIAELFAKMADYVAEKYQLVPVFLPMQYPYDAAISRSILAKMEKKGYFIDNRLSIETIFGVIKRAKLVVAVRLHTLIFSSVLEVPAIGIAYDPKVSGFQRYLRQPYFLDPRALQGGDYKALIDDCMQQYDTVKENLKQQTATMKAMEKRNSELAISLIEEGTEHENYVH